MSSSADSINQILSGISGSLSIMGSSLVIFMIVRRKALKLLRNRLIFILSIFDILVSFALAISIIPSPPLDGWGDPTPGGLGNTATCAVQGFIIQLVNVPPGYNAMQCLYYLAAIKYGTDESTLVKKYELSMHVYAILPNITIGIITLAAGFYESNGQWCWIIDKNSQVITLRKLLMWTTHLYVIVTGSIIIWSMVITYRHVRHQEKEIQRYSFNNAMAQDSGQQEMSAAQRNTFNQAILYVLGFTVTFLFPFLIFISNLFQKADEASAPAVPLPLEILNATFLPLQGFWVCIAYIRPKYVNVRDEDPSIGFCEGVRKVIMDKTVAQIPVTRPMPPQPPLTWSMRRVQLNSDTAGQRDETDQHSRPYFTNLETVVEEEQISAQYPEIREQDEADECKEEIPTSDLEMGIRHQQQQEQHQRRLINLNMALRTFETISAEESPGASSQRRNSLPSPYALEEEIDRISNVRRYRRQSM